MSRKWQISDELYVYNENISMLSNTVEYLILKIKSILDYDYEIENIVTIADKRIKEYNDQLAKKQINFYSDDFTLKNSIINIFENKINLSINELIKIVNKLNHDLYKEIKSSKLILLIIDNNIKKYNKLVHEIKEYYLKDNIDEILKNKYKIKEKLYDKNTLNIMIEFDKKLLTILEIDVDNFFRNMVY